MPVNYSRTVLRRVGRAIGMKWLRLRKELHENDVSKKGLSILDLMVRGAEDPNMSPEDLKNDIFDMVKFIKVLHHKEFFWLRNFVLRAAGEASVPGESPIGMLFELEATKREGILVDWGLKSQPDGTMGVWMKKAEEDDADGGGSE